MLKTVTLEHKDHYASVRIDRKLYLSRSAGVTANASIRSNSDLLFRISAHGRGFLLKASPCMKEMHQHVTFSYETFRNSVGRITDNDMDAADLVRISKRLQAGSKLGSLHLQIDNETGVLQAAHPTTAINGDPINFEGSFCPTHQLLLRTLLNENPN